MQKSSAEDVEVGEAVTEDGEAGAEDVGARRTEKTPLDLDPP